MDDRYEVTEAISLYGLEPGDGIEVDPETGATFMVRALPPWIGFDITNRFRGRLRCLSRSRHLKVLRGDGERGRTDPPSEAAPLRRPAG